jgi:hypothetical protein
LTIFYFVNYFLVFTLLLAGLPLAACWLADGCRFRLWLMVAASACG